MILYLIFYHYFLQVLITKMEWHMNQPDNMFLDYDIRNCLWGDSIKFILV